MVTDYNDDYAATPEYFGSGPDQVLVDHVDLLPRSLPVLDVGAGQGRHALWLAERGFDVVALEPSPVAREQLFATAAKRGLTVRVVADGFETFSAERGTFGSVLVFGLVQMLARDGVEQLTARVLEWLGPGGILVLVAWTTADPAFPEWSTTCRPIGRNSFARDDGETRTFLEPGEILELLPLLEPVFHWEGLGPWHRHGDGEPERHARVEMVLRRPG